MLFDGFVGGSLLELPTVERREATGDRFCVERGVDCVRWTGAIVMVRVASGLCFESRWRGSKRRKEEVRRQPSLEEPSQQEVQHGMSTDMKPLQSGTKEKERE